MGLEKVWHQDCKSIGWGLADKLTSETKQWSKMIYMSYFQSQIQSKHTAESHSQKHIITIHLILYQSTPEASTGILLKRETLVPESTEIHAQDIVKLYFTVRQNVSAISQYVTEYNVHPKHENLKRKDKINNCWSLPSRSSILRNASLWFQLPRLLMKWEKKKKKETLAIEFPCHCLWAQMGRWILPFVATVTWAH